MTTKEKYTQLQINRSTRRLMERVRRRRRWTLKVIVEEGVKRLIAEDEGKQLVGAGVAGADEARGR